MLIDAQGTLHNMSTHNALLLLQDIKVQKATFSEPSDIWNLDGFENFLMSSLETKFQCTIIKYTGMQMNGPTFWQLIVHGSQSNLIFALMALTQKGQKMELKQYEGENVKRCTTNIFDMCNRLDTAGELPKNIGLIICEILLACSVKEFHLQFMMKHLELMSSPTSAADCQELIILTKAMCIPDLGA